MPGGLDSDSCNYAVVAKEALLTHKWLNLYDPIYGGPFYYHYPLCIWVTKILFAVLGISTFSAKLFSMLCGLGLVAVIFYLGRILKNDWVGFFGAISFLLTNHIIRLARQCRMDIPVTLFISLAILSFILAQRRSRSYYLLFGLFTCLAIFTKDVFGLAPLAIVGIYLVLRLRFKELFHPLFILGLLAAVLPVKLWTFLDKGMLAGNYYSANFLHLWKHILVKVPWYYYIWVLLTKYFYFLPLALYGGYLAVGEARRTRKPEAYLLIIWAIIFPLAFSFGRQKLHYFILPIYPAAGLLAGWALESLFKESLKYKIAATLKYIAIFSSIIMLSLPINIRSRRFAETARLGPVFDEVLKQAPESDFLVYNQDTSAVIFYSQRLTRVRYFSDKKALENELSSPGRKVKFCYLPEAEFVGLSPAVKSNCRIIVRFKEMLLVSSPRMQEFIATLPK
jgi:4-amino-4-deoxy-L-arabinose transferase-like glycosyltransferase